MFFYSESGSELSQVVQAPSDPYFYSTSLLMKMNSDFSDSSFYGQTVTTGVNASISNSEFKYDGGSGYFNGNGDHVSVASSDSLDLRGVDWTMETWIRPSGNHDNWRMILTKRSSSGDYNYQLYMDRYSGEIRFYGGGQPGDITTGVTPNANVWSHLAVVRYNGTVTIYLNGTSIGSGVADTDFNSQPLGIGCVANGTNGFGGHGFSGYMDDVRITKGVARYTSNFAVPGSHLTTGPSEIVSTDLQLHLDAGDTNSYPGNGTTWFDLSGNGYHHTLTNPTYEEFVGAYGFNINENGKGIRDAGSTFTYGEQYTIQVWAAALPDSQAPNYRTLLRSHPNDHALLIEKNTNTIGYYDNDNGGAFVSYGLNAGTLGLENNWALYTIVGNAGSTTLYINGLSHSGTVPKTLSGNQHRSIGATTPNPVQPFGRIAVVTTYSRTLSDAEVLQNFEVTKSRFGL